MSRIYDQAEVDALIAAAEEAVIKAASDEVVRRFCGTERTAAAVLGETHDAIWNLLKTSGQGILVRHDAELRERVLEEVAKHICDFSDEYWTVRCSCGWSSDQCNEREYTSRFAEHIRTLKESR